MTTATAAAPKRRRSREETRQRLMEASLSVFARYGYERATVDEIVREAGFSKGAFYVHFESKEDLFWEMLQDRIDAQQELFRQSIQMSAPIEDAQKEVLDTLFGMVKKEPLSSAVFQEFAAHAARNDRVRERLSRMYERWHSFTVEMLEKGRDAGLVRTDVDISLLASAMIALVEGSLTQARLAPERLRLDRRTDQLARLISDWISPR